MAYFTLPVSIRNNNVRCKKFITVHATFKLKLFYNIKYLAFLKSQFYCKTTICGIHTKLKLLTLCKNVIALGAVFLNARKFEKKSQLSRLRELPLLVLTEQVVSNNIQQELFEQHSRFDRSIFDLMIF